MKTENEIYAVALLTKSICQGEVAEPLPISIRANMSIYSNKNLFSKIVVINLTQLIVYVLGKRKCKIKYLKFSIFIVFVPKMKKKKKPLIKIKLFMTST